MTTRTAATGLLRTTITGGLALVVLSGAVGAGAGHRTTVADELPTAAGARVVATQGAVAASRERRTTDLGFVARIRTDRGRTTIAFDRAVLHTGAAAAAERARRGLDPDAPEHYLANDHPRLRTYVLAPDVVVTGSQVLTGTPASVAVPLSRLREHVASRAAGDVGPPFTLTFDREGRVTGIAELYLA